MAYYIFLYLLSRLIYSCAVWGRGGRNLISQAFVVFFLGFFANNLFRFFFVVSLPVPANCSCIICNHGNKTAQQKEACSGTRQFIKCI